MTIQILIHGYADDGFDTYMVSKKFTRVGYGGSSDLVLKVAGMPEQVLLLERLDDADTLKVHVKVSQFVVLHQQPLEQGEDAYWKPGEKMSVGDLTLLLKINNQEENNVKYTPTVIPVLKKKKSPENVKPEVEEKDEEVPQEKKFELIKAVEIAIIVIAIIVVVIFFLSVMLNTNSGAPARRASYTQLESYVSKSRDFDFEFVKRFQEAHAREISVPQFVGHDYLELQQKVRIVLQEEKRKNEKRVIELQEKMKGNIGLKESIEEEINNIKSNSYISPENQALLIYINERVRRYPIKGER